MYFIEPGFLDIVNPCKHLHKIENIDIFFHFFRENVKPLSMFSISNMISQFWSEGRRLQGLSKLSQYVCTVLHDFLNNQKSKIFGF